MVAVSEEVYRAWWQETEHACYLERQAQAREISWQSQPKINDEDFLAYLRTSSAPADEQRQRLIAALYRALADEPAPLQEALWGLALGETSQQDLAQSWGVSQSAVSQKIANALKRLREKIKNN